MCLLLRSSTLCTFGERGSSTLRIWSLVFRCENRKSALIKKFCALKLQHRSHTWLQNISQLWPNGWQTHDIATSLGGAADPWWSLWRGFSGQELEALALQVPGKEDQEKKWQIWQALQRLCANVLGDDFQLFPFGSSSNGCGESDSDMDMVISDGGSNKTAVGKLDEIASACQMYHFTVKAFRKKAKVPILMLQKDGIDIDLATCFHCWTPVYLQAIHFSIHACRCWPLQWSAGPRHTPSRRATVALFHPTLKPWWSCITCRSRGNSPRCMWWKMAFFHLTSWIMIEKPWNLRPSKMLKRSGAMPVRWILLSCCADSSVSTPRNSRGGLMWYLCGWANEPKTACSTPPWKQKNRGFFKKFCCKSNNCCTSKTPSTFDEISILP